MARALVGYARQKEWLGPALIVLAAAFVLVLAANALPRKDGADGLAGWWANWLDPFLAAATVLLAFGLWAAGLAGRWRASLPKTLTVHFALESDAGREREYVYSCYDAYLPGASDIRAWGQQIGQQMNGGLLSFFPYMSERGPELTSSGDGSFRQAYVVTFFLREDERPGYTVWYENDERTARNKEVHLRVRPASPLSPVQAEAKKVKEAGISGTPAEGSET